MTSRWLQGSTLAFVVMLWAGAAMAAPADPVCAAYKRNFDKVAGGDDPRALAKALGDIPPACADLRRSAQDALAVSRKRAADREQARKEEQERQAQARAQAAAEQAVADRRDDAAYDSAVAANTTAGYDTYLSAYPSGRHLWQARNARQVLVDAAKPKHISFNLCNKGTIDIDSGLVYQPVGDTQNWRFVGWYRVAKNECRVLFETDNRNIYVWAKETGSGPVHWGETDIAGRKAQNECYVTPGPYDFTLPANSPCPANATMKPFLWLVADQQTGAFTFTLTGP